MSGPFTRDMIQGFLDGFVAAGGDPVSVYQALTEYMDNHPTYQAPQVEKDLVMKDLKSYRVSSQADLAPSSVAKPEGAV